ncbi:MAG: PP2C family protein-serine/threonine phosphatase [Planctomycetota bacterium]|jgi:phosphoserine phosphatase
MGEERPDSTGPWFSHEELGRFAEFLTGDSARDQRNFMTLLATVTEVLGEPDFTALLRKLVDHAIMTTRTERGILLLLEKGKLVTKVARDKRRRNIDPDTCIAHTICDRVLKFDKPVFERVSDELEGRSISESVAAMRLRQVMCAPLRARGRTLGVVYVDSTLSGPAPKPADLVLFHAQAGLMGMAIQNHRLIRDALEAKAMNQQLKIARQIQRQLLPRSPASMAGVEFAGFSQPSHRVGGDYFDYFALDSNRVGLSVGDVSGHGIGPALIMSNVRAYLRSLLLTRRSLNGLYGIMNQALCHDMGDEMFVSLFVCVYHSDRGVVEFQNAGHVAPLVYSASEKEFRVIEPNAPALGIIDDLSAGPCPHVEVKRGDLVICYTDGVTEMHDRAGSLFGEEGLRRSVQRAIDAGGGPPEIIEAVREDCYAHAQGLPPRDDVTLAVMRC